MAKTYFKGLKDTELIKKEVAEIADTTLFENSKNIKLRFTRKQYETFLSACDILNVLSSHQGFNEYVKAVLGNDIELSSIRKQLVDPILQAPERIQNTEIKTLLRTNRQVKATNSYFTEQIKMTDACHMLYDAVKENLNFQMKYPVDENIVCIVDIRKMLTVYSVTQDLKKPQGTVFDDFLQKLAPNTFAAVKSSLVSLVGSSEILIPKGDIKTIHTIVKEIAS